MSAIDLVKNFPNPTEEQIREQLDGNLCRCTGYHNIVKAVALPRAKPSKRARRAAKQCRSSNQL